MFFLKYLGIKFSLLFYGNIIPKSKINNLETNVPKSGRDCLSNKQRLSNNDIETDICQTYTEYNWHLLLCCKDSIACWRQQNLWSQLEQQMLLADGFKEIFTNILQCFNEDQLITFAMTTWSLWRKRNMQL
jgi:hypothetical protein